jgi:ADP-heptose:LPS heptosyltransferase
MRTRRERWRENLRIALDYVGFRLVAMTVRSTAAPRPKSLLVIRLDAIGDYVLFRNFLGALRASPRYAGYEFTLLGNLAWREIAETLDCAVIDRFIWVDRNRYFSDLRYRRRKLREIVGQGYDVVINPRHSREFTDSELVCKVRARQKIGSVGDATNMWHWQKRQVDRCFGCLLPSAPGVLFEFERNQAFFEGLLGQRVPVDRPSMHITSPPEHTLPTSYVLLFIGASAESRRWSSSGFAQIAARLRAHDDLGVVLCGAPSDQPAARIFARHYRGEFVDLVGKTSVTELLRVVARARLVMTNETSVGHLAVALDVPHVVVVSNGNQYGRFSPYPPHLAPGYRAVFPPAIEVMRQEEATLRERYRVRSDLDINQITVDAVMRAIHDSGFGRPLDLPQTGALR